MIVKASLRVLNYVKRICLILGIGARPRVDFQKG